MAQAEDLLAFIERLENPNVNVDQVKCLKVRNRNSTCQRCVDACPGECFVFSGKDNQGYRYAVGRRGGDVRGLVRAMNAALSGRGGGKNEMAQGSLQATGEQIEAWLREKS